MPPPVWSVSLKNEERKGSRKHPSCVGEKNLSVELNAPDPPSSAAPSVCYEGDKNSALARCAVFVAVSSE